MITLRNAIDEIINTVKETSSHGVGGPFGAFVPARSPATMIRQHTLRL